MISSKLVFSISLSSHSPKEAQSVKCQKDCWCLDSFYFVVVSLASWTLFWQLPSLSCCSIPLEGLILSCATNFLFCSTSCCSKGFSWPFIAFVLSTASSRQLCRILDFITAGLIWVDRFWGGKQHSDRVFCWLVLCISRIYAHIGISIQHFLIS